MTDQPHRRADKPPVRAVTTYTDGTEPPTETTPTPDPEKEEAKLLPAPTKKNLAPKE